MKFCASCLYTHSLTLFCLDCNTSYCNGGPEFEVIDSNSQVLQLGYVLRGIRDSLAARPVTDDYGCYHQRVQ